MVECLYEQMLFPFTKHSWTSLDSDEKQEVVTRVGDMHRVAEIKLT